MKLLIVLVQAVIHCLCAIPNPEYYSSTTETSSSESTTTLPKTEDVEYDLFQIMMASDVTNMCSDCAVYLVQTNGNLLHKYEDKESGYIESAIKLTKKDFDAENKIQYLTGAGLLKINSGEMALESVDFNIFGAEASLTIGGMTPAGGFKLAGGFVSSSELQLALGITTTESSQPKTEDVEYSLDHILAIGDYDDMCYTCSVYLVKRNGNLHKYDSMETGYIETAIKLTKDFAGPKIQYLAGAGLVKINKGGVAIESVDFNVFGAEASVFYSPYGAGYSAVVKLAGGSVSIFDLQLALGISSQLGIVDDSLSVKVLGTGVSIGRVTRICAFDVCFGFDFGKLG